MSFKQQSKPPQISSGDYNTKELEMFYSQLGVEQLEVEHRQKTYQILSYHRAKEVFVASGDANRLLELVEKRQTELQIEADLITKFIKFKSQ